MKTQFELVRDYFATHGDELTERDYKEALMLLEVNDKITSPTNQQVIDEIERLIGILMDDLDDQETYGV